MANITDGPTWEFHKTQLAASLENCAQAMRQCANIADHFSAFVRALGPPHPGAPMMHAMPPMPTPVLPQLAAILGVPPAAEHPEVEKTRKRKAPPAEDGAEEGKKKRSKKPKDPNAPRRPASSYILYQNQVRKDLRTKFPNLSNAELLNLISKQWGDMTDDEKAVYNQATADAKEKFYADKKAYENRTPEEIAAANAATEEAAAVKKTKRSRAPKAPKAAAKANGPVPVPSAPKAVASSHDEGSDIEEESSEEDGRTAPTRHTPATAQDSDSDDSEDDSEDEDAAPVQTKAAEPSRTKRKSHA